MFRNSKLEAKNQNEHDQDDLPPEFSQISSSSSEQGFSNQQQLILGNPPLINIASENDESLFKVECQHCKASVEIGELDQHELDCQEDTNRQAIEQLIEQQEQEFDEQEESKTGSLNSQRRGNPVQTHSRVQQIQDLNQNQYNGNTFGQNNRYEDTANIATTSSFEDTGTLETVSRMNYNQILNQQQPNQNINAPNSQNLRYQTVNNQNQRYNNLVNPPDNFLFDQQQFLQRHEQASRGQPRPQLVNFNSSRQAVIRASGNHLNNEQTAPSSRQRRPSGQTFLPQRQQNTRLQAEDHGQSGQPSAQGAVPQFQSLAVMQPQMRVVNNNSLESVPQMTSTTSLNSSSSLGNHHSSATIQLQMVHSLVPMQRAWNPSSSDQLQQEDENLPNNTTGTIVNLVDSMEQQIYDEPRVDLVDIDQQFIRMNQQLQSQRNDPTDPRVNRGVINIPRLNQQTGRNNRYEQTTIQRANRYNNDQRQESTRYNQQQVVMPRFNIEATTDNLSLMQDTHQTHNYPSIMNYRRGSQGLHQTESSFQQDSDNIQSEMTNSNIQQQIRFIRQQCREIQHIIGRPHDQPEEFDDSIESDQITGNNEGSQYFLQLNNPYHNTSDQQPSESANGTMSLVMPMRMTDFQLVFSMNPNNRQDEERDSEIESSNNGSQALSQNSSVQGEDNRRMMMGINIGQEENETDDEIEIQVERNQPQIEIEDEEEEKKVFVENNELAGAFRFRRPPAFEEVLVDEIDMREQLSIDPRLQNLLLRPNQMMRLHNQPNLRPRIQPFNQARISQQQDQFRNDGEEDSADDIQDHDLSSTGLNFAGDSSALGRRARFFPFHLFRPGQGSNLRLAEDEDEMSATSSYNFMVAEEEATTFMEQIVNRANAFRNFDDYEALLNLDDNIVQSVPEEVLKNLPIAKFNENNKANFSEENKSCTICMCHYEITEEYLILPCLHRFHNECIKEWFTRRNTCPNCKDRIMDHFGDHPAASRQGQENGFNIANNSLIFRSSNNEHDFGGSLLQINDEVDEDDPDYSQRLRYIQEQQPRRIQYVQGQRIRPFDTRIRFILNEDANNEEGSVNTRMRQRVSGNIRNINALAQISQRMQQQNNQSMNPGGAAAAAVVINPSSQPLNRQRNDQEDSRPQMAGNQGLSQNQRSQQPEFVDFDVGSADDEDEAGYAHLQQPDDDEEEEESSLM